MGRGIAGSLGLSYLLIPDLEKAKKDGRIVSYSDLARKKGISIQRLTSAIRQVPDDLKDVVTTKAELKRWRTRRETSQ